MYSLGMCFYEIMTARQPFEDMDTWKIGCKKKKTGQYQKVLMVFFICRRSYWIRKVKANWFVAMFFFHRFCLSRRPDLPEISDYCPEAFHEMVLTTWKSEPKDRCDTAELLKLICQELEVKTQKNLKKLLIFNVCRELLDKIFLKNQWKKMTIRTRSKTLVWILLEKEKNKKKHKKNNPSNSFHYQQPLVECCFTYIFCSIWAYILLTLVLPKIEFYFLWFTLCWVLEALKNKQLLKCVSSEMDFFFMFRKK